MSKRYEPGEVEPRWQRYWEEHKTFRATEIPGRPKYYALDMFPYPSAAGLHVGHPEGYTATDIISRYKRMRGYNVLHPMGWDAFGLPAEQYAIQTGQHPAGITHRNIATFRRQLKMLGFAYDWEREIATIDPGYYRWTQWIFLQLYKRGLAYVAELPVNWCPELGTVLANEEVVNGVSERGGFPVVRKPMRQWVLRITAYADRLLEDLDLLDWPESLKEMQRNWIGRSEGAEVVFAVQGHADQQFRVFTTRPDTLFGATYAVLAPEHPLVDAITTPAQREAVAAYREAAARKSDFERTEVVKEKTGVWTGARAVNPANGQAIPIWIADYVLGSYGTGAIMAVPGHDQRDWEFARRFNLPIVEVVRGGNLEEAAYTADGPHVNSSFLDGLDVVEAKARMNDWLEARGLGQRKVTYKLRDWLFSRQRYWGEPIPILHLEDGTTKPVPESELPLLLPDMEEVKPSGTGESPLANVADWVNTVDPETGMKARRETNTMPQWAGSCWYYLRFIDPHNPGALVDREKEQYWMPVDLYIGGAEHAVLHLLYARFWHKVLYDIGVVSTKEPFQRLVNQGMILGEQEITGYQRADGSWVSAAQVTADVDGKHRVKGTDEAVIALRVPGDQAEKLGDAFVLSARPDIRLDSRAHKMSKSRGNVVNPDDVVKDFGADTLRTYLMFMGPLEKEKPWDTNGVEGVFRFILRVWRLIDTWADESGPEDADTLQRLRHQTIKKVTQDIDALKFNTAIPQLMGYVNELYKVKRARKEDLETLTLLIAPFAPHLAEECWARLGNPPSVSEQPWPEYVEALTLEDTLTLAIQVNGKLRGEVQVPADIDAATAIARAREPDNVARHLEGRQIVKEIYVKGKLVNFVVK